MENRPAIEAKIRELNRESAGLPANVLPITVRPPGTQPVIPGIIHLQEAPQVWQEFPGYSALTKFEYNNGAPIFSPSVGVPVKAFLNTRTGEIRTFVASIFEIQ